MGCGCGGKAQLQSLQPKKILSLEEMRQKVFSGVKQNSSVPQADLPTKTIPTIVRKPVIMSNVLLTPDNLFQTLKQPVDLCNPSLKQKTVMVVIEEGSAESKYIKNIITKLVAVHNDYKENLLFISVSKTYIIDTKDIDKYPCTLLFSNNSLYKKYTGLFDVQKALNEFLSLNQ